MFNFVKYLFGIFWDDHIFFLSSDMLNSIGWFQMLNQSYLVSWDKHHLDTMLLLLLMFSHRVVSDSLRPCELTVARQVPCPSYLPEFAQSHIHWVGGAIQPSHPLSPSSPFCFSLSQHQGVFQWVGSSHQVAQVLELQFQHQFQTFQWIFKGWFPLELIGLISLQSKGLLRVFSSTTIWKHQFFDFLPFYGPTLTFAYDRWKDHVLLLFSVSFSFFLMILYWNWVNNPLLNIEIVYCV